MDEELESKPTADAVPQISFDEMLAALRDQSVPFPARYLYRLSDLVGEELGLIRRVWPDLLAQRRLGILEDLEMLAESNTVTNFDALNRVALNDPDPLVRVVAIRSLWPSEQADLVPIFLDLLQNAIEPPVRAQSAAALGRFVYLGEVGKVPSTVLKQVEERLLKVMSDDADQLVKRRALESLGYSSLPELADLIEQAYEGDNEEWVVSALYAMGRSADDRWAPLILERLNDSNNEISREAARAAGELELGDALPALVELLQDDDSELRLAAAWSLSQIGGNGAAEALEELMERTEDEDEIDLIENAIENLGFTQEISDLSLLDFSPEDLEEFAHPDLGPALDDEDPAAE